MTIYVLRLAAASRTGRPTKIELLGPFPTDVSAHDWSRHPEAGGSGTLRMTVVDILDEPEVAYLGNILTYRVPVKTPRTVW